MLLKEPDEKLIRGRLISLGGAVDSKFTVLDTSCKVLVAAPLPFMRCNLADPKIGCYLMSLYTKLAFQLDTRICSNYSLCFLFHGSFNLLLLVSLQSCSVSYSCSWS